MLVVCTPISVECLWHIKWFQKRWARASFFLACYRYSRVSRPFALFKAKYCKSQRTRYRAAYLPSTSYKYEKLRVEAQVDGNFPIRICPTYGLAVKLCVEGGYTCHWPPTSQYPWIAWIRAVFLFIYSIFRYFYRSALMRCRACICATCYQRKSAMARIFLKINNLSILWTHCTTV